VTLDYILVDREAPSAISLFDHPATTNETMSTSVGRQAPRLGSRLKFNVQFVNALAKSSNLFFFRLRRNIARTGVG